MKLEKAWAGVAQWTECRPAKRKATDSIPSQGIGLGPQPPQLGARTPVGGV